MHSIYVYLKNLLGNWLPLAVTMYGVAHLLMVGLLVFGAIQLQAYGFALGLVVILFVISAIVGAVRANSDIDKWNLFIVTTLGIAASLTFPIMVLVIVLDNNPSSETDRHITVIAINDIYRLTGVRNGTVGGLHRVAELRRRVLRDDPEALLLHAGDFLSPSLLSDMFKGEQMIDAMNALDNDRLGFDTRMFVALGNHEFDLAKCGERSASVLRKRISESQFTWLDDHLDFAKCGGLEDLRNMAQLQRRRIITANGVRVGLFGVGMSGSGGPPPGPDDEEAAIENARRATQALVAAGADLVIALTHLNKDVDERVIEAMAAVTERFFLIGGHDHDAMTLPEGDGTVRGVKADSDAKTAYRLRITLPVDGGAPEVEEQLLELGDIYDGPANSLIQQIAATWLEKYSTNKCNTIGMQNNCLEKHLGTAAVDVSVNEQTNRSEETNIGNWIADAVREQTGADVAIVPSGILHSDIDIASGAPVTRLDVFELVRFDKPMPVKKYKASTLCTVLRQAFEKSGTGGWPHVSEGVRAEIHETSEGSSTNHVAFKIDEEDFCNKSNKTRLIEVATTIFHHCGGDGYPTLPVNHFEDKKHCMTILESHFSNSDTLSNLLETQMITHPSNIFSADLGRVVRSE